MWRMNLKLVFLCLDEDCWVITAKHGKYFPDLKVVYIYIYGWNWLSHNP